MLFLRRFDRGTGASGSMSTPAVYVACCGGLHGERWRADEEGVGLGRQGLADRTDKGGNSGGHVPVDLPAEVMDHVVMAEQSGMPFSMQVGPPFSQKWRWWISVMRRSQPLTRRTYCRGGGGWRGAAPGSTCEFVGRRREFPMPL